MAIVVLHTDNYGEGTRGNHLLRSLRSEGEPADAAMALAAGLYLAVAVIPGDDLHGAYVATQNRDGSWSREGAGLRVVGKGEIPSPRGALAYRSSGTGDLFVLDGEVHVLSERGMRPVPGAMPPAGNLRAPDGATLAEALADASRGTAYRG